jgi:hypothetical protein
MKEGWNTSIFENASVCILSPDTALLSVKFIRYRTDRSTMASYLLAQIMVYVRAKAGWPHREPFYAAAESDRTCNE